MSLASVVPPRLRQLLAKTGAQRVWLVGGALRDHFLGLPIHDLDLVVDGDAIELGRRLANGLHGAFYILDRERGAARIVRPAQLPGIRTLDLVRMQADGIEQDLRARDFTANALALMLPQAPHLLDPTGGLQDIKDRRLRACSPDAIDTDPVRGLRAIRLALALEFALQPETITQIREGAHRLGAVSAERIRDEFLRMLTPGLADRSVRLLHRLGLLAPVLPEVVDLIGRPLPSTQVGGSPVRAGLVPNSQEPIDLWEHTLQVLQRLDELLQLLTDGPHSESAGNIVLAEASLALGRFRPELAKSLSVPDRHGRSAVQILLLAALYHEAGWLADQGQWQADFDPEAAAAQAVRDRCMALKLSTAEARRAHATLRHQRRPQAMRGQETVPPLEIYHYFRELGEVGISIVFLSLAEVLVEHSLTPHVDAWRDQVRVARQLLEAYLEGPPEAIRPLKLIRGDELARRLGIQPGAELGRLLQSIEEAQVLGIVNTAEQALKWARRQLDEPGRGHVSLGSERA